MFRNRLRSDEDRVKEQVELSTVRRNLDEVEQRLRKLEYEVFVVGRKAVDARG